MQLCSVSYQQPEDVPPSMVMSDAINIELLLEHIKLSKHR